jgi:hypothetical protein
VADDDFGDDSLVARNRHPLPFGAWAIFLIAVRTAALTPDAYILHLAAALTMVVAMFTMYLKVRYSICLAFSLMAPHSFSLLRA